MSLPRTGNKKYIFRSTRRKEGRTDCEEYEIGTSASSSAEGIPILSDGNAFYSADDPLLPALVKQANLCNSPPTHDALKRAPMCNYCSGGGENIAPLYWDRASKRRHNVKEW